MAAPILSLTDEAGLLDSNLTKMADWPSLTRRIGIIGVLPINSRGSLVMVLCFFEVNQPILRDKMRIKQDMTRYFKLEYA